MMRLKHYVWPLLAAVLLAGTVSCGSRDNLVYPHSQNKAQAGQEAASLLPLSKSLQWTAAESGVESVDVFCYLASPEEPCYRRIQVAGSAAPETEAAQDSVVTDKQGHVLSRYYPSGQLKEEWENRADGAVCRHYTEKGGLEQVEEYDAQGYLVKRVSLDPLWNKAVQATVYSPLESRTVDYRAGTVSETRFLASNVSVERNTRLDGSLISEKRSLYNNQGLVAFYQSVAADGSVTAESYNYFYDSKGNWILSVVLSKDPQHPSLMAREIRYQDGTSTVEELHRLLPVVGAMLNREIEIE